MLGTIARWCTSAIFKKAIFSMTSSGMIVWIFIIACVIFLPGCSRSKKMLALARQDPSVKDFFSNDVYRMISFRKEVLIPVSSGKKLIPNEDFIEVWWNDDLKAGWVYYCFDGPFISRSGCQQIDHQFVISPGPRVKLSSIDDSAISATIMDGKEFKWLLVMPNMRKISLLTTQISFCCGSCVIII